MQTLIGGPCVYEDKSNGPRVFEFSGQLRRAGRGGLQRRLKTLYERWRDGDGYLTASEIAALKLDADRVILSSGLLGASNIGFRFGATFAFGS